MNLPSLLLDLGNRHAKWARPGLQQVIRVPLESTQIEASVRAVLQAAASLCEAPGSVLAASVAPRWAAQLEPALSAAGYIWHSLGPERVPLQRKSEGTGVDRLLCAWRAYRMQGGPVIVASLGTAFTLDATDAAGCFHGGAIGPGLGVQEAALAAAAPHLPPPDPDWRPGRVPARSAEAIACGTRGALARALSALADEFEQTLGSASCARIVTGGDAQRLLPLLGPAWTLEEDLVLAALNDLAWLAQ